MKVEFTVFGQPVAKGRPRFRRFGNFVRTYTPEKTVSYENIVRIEYENQCEGIRFEKDVPLVMTIDAYFEIPKSTSKKKANLMEQRKIRPVTKCDFDNLAKIYADALNDVAYSDDKQVVDGCVRKWYSENPRAEIKIEEWNQDLEEEEC